VTVGERERVTLARVVETIVPDAPARVVADTIVAELEAVGRPKLVNDLVLFLKVIEQPLVNLATTGRATRFGELEPNDRETYLLRWADSALPLRRMAFQAVKRLALFIAYSRSSDGDNPLWAGTGFERAALAPLPVPPARLVMRAHSKPDVVKADAIVVGSGAGGAVAAAELAAGGRKVLVLEQGGLSTESTFDGDEADGAARLFWGRQLLTTEDLGLSVFAGRTVGGGTVVNWSTSLRLPVEVREEWAAAGLDGMGREFDEHYAAVEQRIDVDTNESEPNAPNALLAKGFDALGLGWIPIPRNVKGCGDCGSCGYGCRRGAKQSTLVTYLADACTNGAEIIAGCHVDRITTANGRVTGIQGSVNGVGIRAEAPVVVLAGGALGTPALLLRSKLGGPTVGESLHLHPVAPVVGLYEQPVRIWSGVPQAVVSDAFARLDGAYGFRLEIPSALIGVLSASLPWRSAAEHRALMARAGHASVIIPIVRDRESGRVTVDRQGRALVHYRVHGQTERHTLRSIVEAARVHLAAGAREVLTLHTAPLRLRPADDVQEFAREVERRGIAPNRVGMFSAHQMSTARMGAHVGSSVADPDGRVWGVDGLIVADASAFPNASGVNPMLTVMALARRNVSRMLAAGEKEVRTTRSA
jgi:choline dehydrogenase-like flavoprotein